MAAVEEDAVVEVEADREEEAAEAEAFHAHLAEVGEAILDRPVEEGVRVHLAVVAVVILDLREAEEAVAFRVHREEAVLLGPRAAAAVLPAHREAQAAHPALRSCLPAGEAGACRQPQRSVHLAADRSAAARHSCRQETAQAEVSPVATVPRRLPHGPVGLIVREPRTVPVV